jgi:hypothetical protein
MMGSFCGCVPQVFTTRNMAQMASNAETIKEQVEEFKSVVPLVQVRTAEKNSMSLIQNHVMLSLYPTLLRSALNFVHGAVASCWRVWC